MDITTALLTIAVVAANILGVGMLIPQAIRILKHDSLEGVSSEWIGMGLSVNAGWLVYAYTAEVWGLVGVSAGGFLLYLAMAVGVRRLDPVRFDRARTTALIILNGLGWITAFGPEPALGLSLAAMFTVQFSPAAWTAWTSSTLTGISPATWLLALAEAAIWVIYGAALGDQALYLGGVGATTMSALVLLRLWTAPAERTFA